MVVTSEVSVAPARFGPTARRILAATAECVAAQGLRGTSIDDIAAAAGCARATVYRLFPGGRSGLMAAVAEVQVAEVLAVAGAAVDAEDDLASAVAGAVHASCVELAGHAALQRLLVEEPGAVLPFISFDRLGPLLALAADWGRAHLARFLPVDEAEAVGEWCARVVLAHLRSPGSPTDTTDPVAVRRLVEHHLLPGLADVAAPRPAPAERAAAPARPGTTSR
jgi:AcrR family transcriptional regulator